MAAIAFPSAREAGRRIAGVAAAARIVRELAEAGFASIWLRVPVGEAIDAAAMDDVRRLAGSTAVRIGEPPADERVTEIPGKLLIPAEAIPAFLASDRSEPAGAIHLTRRGAAPEILRRTGKATDGPVSRWLNRPVSRALSRILLTIPGFRPLHATAGNAVLALLMFAALAFGGGWGLVAGGLLFQAASIVDGVDGEVARATFRSSPAGARLDTALDTLTTLLFVVGMTINLAASGHDNALALAAWGLTLFVSGLALIAWHAARVGGSLNFLRIKRHYRGRFSNVLFARFVAFATVVSSRDFFALLFAVLTVTGLAMGVLYLFAVAASVWILFVAGSLLSPREGSVAAENA